MQLTGTLALGLALFVSIPSHAQTAQIRVFTSNGVKAATEEIYPKNVIAQYDTTASLRRKAEAGEPFDAAILTTDAIDALIKAGKIAPDSRTEIARAGIGVGYRKGAAKPDISTPDALKKTLLNAKSITYNEVGASRQYIDKLFVKLGIADQVKAKTVLEQESGRPQMDVGEGKAELVLTLVPEILPYKGVELAGPLPEELQSYITFAAGVSANTKNAEGAKALIKLVTDPSKAPVLKARGLR